MVKIYCGSEPLPKNSKYGTLDDCAAKKQIRLYGLRRADPKSIARSKISQLNIKELDTKSTRQERINYIVTLRAQLKKIKNVYEKLPQSPEKLSYGIQLSELQRLIRNAEIPEEPVIKRQVVKAPVEKVIKAPVKKVVKKKEEIIMDEDEDEDEDNEEPVIDNRLALIIKLTGLRGQIKRIQNDIKDEEEQVKEDEKQRLAKPNKNIIIDYEVLEDLRSTLNKLRHEYTVLAASPILNTEAPKPIVKKVIPKKVVVYEEPIVIPKKVVTKKVVPKKVIVYEEPVVIPKKVVTKKVVPKKVEPPPQLITTQFENLITPKILEKKIPTNITVLKKAIYALQKEHNNLGRSQTNLKKLYANRLQHMEVELDRLLKNKK